VNYSFDNSDILEIDPKVGTILINGEVKIKLKILDILPIQYQVNDQTQTVLKQKTTKIYFKSNAGDKEITVTY
jgi:hypothetical protein